MVDFQSFHAILIGISNYNGTSRLSFANDDAKNLANFLKSQFHVKVENISLLLDGNATAEAILDKIASLATSAK